MLFNSLTFLIFFVIVTIVYFILPHRIRWILLLAASCIFYMAWDPYLIALIAFTIFVNYYAALKIYRCGNRRLKKRILVLCMTVNFGMLFVFKYTEARFSPKNTLGYLRCLFCFFRSWWPARLRGAETFFLSFTTGIHLISTEWSAGSESCSGASLRKL